MYVCILSEVYQLYFLCMCPPPPPPPSPLSLLPLCRVHSLNTIVNLMTIATPRINQQCLQKFDLTFATYVFLCWIKNLSVYIYDRIVTVTHPCIYCLL